MSFEDGFNIAPNQLITWLEHLLFRRRFRDADEGTPINLLLEECVEHRPTDSRDMYLACQAWDDLYDELNVVKQRYEEECPF
jgi:hypothetical protein